MQKDVRKLLDLVNAIHELLYWTAILLLVALLIWLAVKGVQCLATLNHKGGFAHKMKTRPQQKTEGMGAPRTIEMVV